MDEHDKLILILHMVNDALDKDVNRMQEKWFYKGVLTSILDVVRYGGGYEA